MKNQPKRAGKLSFVYGDQPKSCRHENQTRTRPLRAIPRLTPCSIKVEKVLYETSSGSGRNMHKEPQDLTISNKGRIVRTCAGGTILVVTHTKSRQSGYCLVEKKPETEEYTIFRETGSSETTCRQPKK